MKLIKKALEAEKDKTINKQCLICSWYVNLNTKANKIKELAPRDKYFIKDSTIKTIKRL